MKRIRTWPLLLIAAPAAVAVWSGWVGIGALCGFGPVQVLPGFSHVTVNTAITLPIGVESYGAFALWAWLASGASDTARAFARRSAIGALALGCTGQVAYHLLAASRATRAPATVVVIVACLPVVTLSFAAALVHLLRAEPAAETAISQPVDGRLEQPDISHPVSQKSATPAAASQPPQQPAEQPQRRPASQPRRRAAAIDNGHEAKAARKRYRQSVRDGAPLSDRALGELFKQTRYWGEKRIAEVKAEPALAEAQ